MKIRKQKKTIIKIDFLNSKALRDHKFRVSG